MSRAIVEKIKHHQLQVFIALTIIVSIILVLISMRMYYSAGAYKLDLSRPEYVQIRSQIEKDPKDNNKFDEQGPISKGVLDDFLKRYRAEEESITDSKSFEGDALSDEWIGLSETESDTSSD